MPLPKIEDARNMSDPELADAILAAKRELFELRLQQATRRLEKPHQFKHIKHRISQMMTVIRERELATAQSEQEALAKAGASTSGTAQASMDANAPQPDTTEE